MTEQAAGDLQRDKLLYPWNKSKIVLKKETLANKNKFVKSDTIKTESKNSPEQLENKLYTKEILKR